MRVVPLIDASGRSKAPSQASLPPAGMAGNPARRRVPLFDYRGRRSILPRVWVRMAWRVEPRRRTAEAKWATPGAGPKFHVSIAPQAPGDGCIGQSWASCGRYNRCKTPQRRWDTFLIRQDSGWPFEPLPWTNSRSPDELWDKVPQYRTFVQRERGVC